MNNELPESFAAGVTETGQHCYGTMPPPPYRLRFPGRTLIEGQPITFDLLLHADGNVTWEQV